ncbi:MAG: 50S ribosomal protein L29 [Candidatus Nealsonbacteria bacterium CG23_combo_of_CG06-09_8_20_14_all_40_13]|uniref:Large ribosomal subunit protein uL29 n=1 Tax=Candidatus Nealsonbacteria bacterium CG23_combo_of_CG06-09_8_20_14_all_40_13 TaxID=1974724 RepID=A0A2G9YQS6_9BACT|nr:MAG: 50S ribosomal protein L29 [Candidatus Nealsonbacteria bacterium CG23_combo_of_CG06-09_8_20_14_all_40_13]PIR71197.1 MAG: 50S ribosomal protein L29 [Candidatus Nealsonbacteria bacterium CG10_big_fil_rev_8_21_14_0_10_40_24]PIU43439.1 MAG: 50S ribosomal protein L29 [Candidatus Nealsonbacteria bacterium CG07_land_8_20_14_0_80_40_10]
MKRKAEIAELRAKNIKDLTARIEKNYKELHFLRFSSSVGKQKDLKKARELRKSIARIWSILGETILAEGSKNE